MKKNISFDDYKNCVLNDKPKNVKINVIRTLNLTNNSLTRDKLALSNKDHKRVWSIKTHQEHTDIGETNKSGKNIKETLRDYFMFSELVKNMMRFM